MLTTLFGSVVLWIQPALSVAGGIVLIVLAIKIGLKIIIRGLLNIVTEVKNAEKRKAGAH